VGGVLTAYHDALDALYGRTTGKWKLGLDRTTALLAALGDPHRTLRGLHVAGTNGKGSVCATLEAVLRADGRRVAKYTSPHLVDFRERFVIDGIPVSADRIVAWIERWGPTVETLGATFFEATTAMAFSFFAEEAPDLAVIEVGLGGRLDATNVIDPLVAGVASIGIDHVEWLGETRAAIAREKAGIYKRGRPAVVGDADPGIGALLAACAEEVGATPVVTPFADGPTDDVTVHDGGTGFTWRGAAWQTALVGAHQATNAVLALAMLDVLPAPWRPGPAALREGLAAVRLPGRFDRRGRWLFDVAHNADGARVLATTLAAVHPPAPVVAVVSVLGDKDWRGIIDTLAPHVAHLLLTNAPTAPASRAWDLSSVYAYARRRGGVVRIVRDFDRALAHAAADGATVLVTGSFHTVGDAMARLSLGPVTG
jgi:dihydrofolate synthase/folylpolyglutamate synthase